jgi:hypothetical protein
MVGVVWIFIKNFSLHGHPLIKLTQKNKPFIFSPEQIQVQEDLKAALLESPALCTINYTSPAPVILAVNTSYIAVGFQLCQCDVTTPSRCISTQPPSPVLPPNQDSHHPTLIKLISTHTNQLLKQLSLTMRIIQPLTKQYVMSFHRTLLYAMKSSTTDEAAPGTEEKICIVR